jgi:hypothetical protein
MREREARNPMGANQFFVGVLAGLAMLAIPLTVMGFTGGILNFPDRLAAWINEPGVRAPTPVGVSRPASGYVPGQPTVPPTPESLPTLKPANQPTPARIGIASAPPPNPVYTTGSNGWAQAVVLGADGQAVPLRRAIGVTNATDPLLQPGATVLLSPYGVIRLNGQEWRSVRTPEGAIGWLPAEALAPAGTFVAGVPVPTSPPIGAPSRLRVANTDGQGVVLRASARDDDRTPSALVEGTTVSVLEMSGTDWVHVHADSGLEGWIPSKYLMPAA